MPAVTINTLQGMKDAGQKFACLTCYDASFAHMMSSNGIEVLLVGDTLGMVFQGQASTVPVQMDDILYHVHCVNRSNQGSFLIADMPFMSHATLEDTLHNAARLMRAGAQMVKIEGGAWLVERIEHLSQCGIPVCAHLGLSPQSVHALGGYKIQGREQTQAQQIIDDAQALQAAGAALLVLECVPSALASDIASLLTIPVIGIGAGSGTDAQILVLYDILALTAGKTPRFSKDFLGGQTGGLAGAIAAYAKAVKTGQFPTPEHSFN